ncbi:GTPase Era [Candidatus Woesebacteria bacterium]|nr:GTPase Era [Candidatus Woesebacteria bacterium]
MKAGTVALIGRPNVGKSTLVNNLIGQKVAITSPKPQTTRFPIQGLYEDERGQIVFVDTPGIFRKATDALSKKINQKVMEPFEGNIDLVLYVIDHTRTRDYEESRVLGIVRKFNIPKILVINKIDVEEPSFLPLYKFLEDEFDTVIKVSALEKMHLKTLLEAIFEKMPERDTPLVKKEEYTYPALNIDGKIFLAELIREKVFLRTRKEVPYTTTVLIDEIADRDNGMLYVRARILTTTDKYKKMLIGEGGRRIKEIGSMSRKELETATNRKVFLDLTVESDKHWITNFS